MSRTHNWTSTRQSILVAVFLAYFLNFTLQWLARKSRDEQISQRMRNLRFKVFMFGLLSKFSDQLIEGLFSCSLVHTGILVSIVAWAILVIMVVLHHVNFKQMDDKKRAIVNLALHAALFVYIVSNIASFASQGDS